MLLLRALNGWRPRRWRCYAGSRVPLRGRSSGGLLRNGWFGRFGSDGIERFEQTIVRPLFAAALAGALLAIYQGFVDLKFLSLGPWADLRRAGGALTDANASGALMALWVCRRAGRSSQPPPQPQATFGRTLEDT